MKIDLPATALVTEKKGDTKRLRREGKIPAVLYGHKEKTRQIYVEQKEFKKVLDVLKNETVIVNLKIGSKSYPCVIKALQQNPLEDSFLHIDFQHIHKKEKIRATVPIHTTGAAPGVEKGGILDIHLHEVEVRCLPDALPSHIDVDISNLDLGDAIHLRDLSVPDVEFELSADTTLVSILVPRALEVEVKPAVEEELVAAEEGVVAEEEKEEAKEETEKKEKDKQDVKEDKRPKETPKGGK
ncbi:MAG: 50S ribosomal protein L25 [candidate division WOR-3 bacterium]|nr:MAG: 50S ribosomal protein L25 [candidate division WOR-3 bacterium]